MGGLSMFDQRALGRFVFMDPGTPRLIASQTDNVAIQYGVLGIWWQNVGAMRA